MQCPCCHLAFNDPPSACPRCGLLLDPTGVSEAIRLFRDRVADHLELLGDFQAQLEYPAIDEWLCQWFDDLRFGGMEICREHLYINAFSQTEWTALARFSELFHETKTFYPVEDLQETPQWRRLAQAAVETAKALFGDSGRP